jgi:hypothetical protein
LDKWQRQKEKEQIRQESIRNGLRKKSTGITAMKKEEQEKRMNLIGIVLSLDIVGMKA